MIGIIGVVGKLLFGMKALDQGTSRRHVVLLAGSEFEADRQPEGIDCGMDFGAEATTEATESVGWRCPFFAARRQPRPAP